MSTYASILVLDISVLTTVFCKYFLPVCGLSCHSLNAVSHRAEVLSFDEVQLTIYVFYFMYHD